MNIDLKHDLLKSSIANSKAEQKNVKTTIDQTMVATTSQKTLGMDLQNESTENNSGIKKKVKKDKEKLVKKDDSSSNKADSKIERNPLKLLGLF